ncbi:MAG: anthranilate synthase component I family protein [Proteobacteria bacterium]|nr:anthranilate synthase component I family protein [Pseudomonadota bacterium]MBU1610981.1 anthranilate synthase component I family protein [Pseudomonadota bacterium]
MEKITLRQYGKWLPADVQTTISLFMGLVGDQPGILLESAEVDGRWGRHSLMAWDFRLVLEPDAGKLKVICKDERLAAVKELEGEPYMEGVRKAIQILNVIPNLDGLPGITRGLIGYFGYGVGGMLEPKLATVLPPETAEARLVLPGRVMLFDHLHHRCCFLSLDADAPLSPAQTEWFAPLTVPATVPDAEPTALPNREEYKNSVLQAKELISEGECIQVVLSTRFSVPATDSPFRIYRRLRQVNPSPHMFYMKFEDGVLLGSSPEMMVRCQKGRLEVRPIAGTRPRGQNGTEDLAMERELLADPKERAEHVMLVDLGRNDLGRIATAGSVTVQKFMQVERFSHVMHLTSYVEADLRPGLDAIDVLAATFPAGTVSGAPKIRAMEIIADLELVNEATQDRGPYAGCIGWVGLDEGSVDLDTGITIRSMWIRDGVCYWQAGAGIVFDSDPEKEWQECNNKARVIREVVRGKEDSDVFADR